MREVPVMDIAPILLNKLQSGGIFMSTHAAGESNVMTVGWGGLNVFFGSPCFIVPVRASRHTYTLLRRNSCFTLSIPLRDMRKELMYCGTRSDRNVDKFADQSLTPAQAQAVNAPIVGECELHMECEVLGFTPLAQDTLTTKVTERWYSQHDLHTIFFGQVVRCYYTDNTPEE